jgi:8-oxo-dGTP pyrophosphatase MutT (NUDIX family)
MQKTDDHLKFTEIRVMPARLKSTVLALLLISAPAAPDEVSAASAGVLIFTEMDGVQYVLLADHKGLVQERGWGILAGVIEPDESELDAAVREAVEESNGVFDETVLRNAIDSSNYIFDNDFTMYFADIGFEPATVYTYSVANIDHGVNGERGPFAWIPWSVVSEAAADAERVGSACWDQPVPIPLKYLPEPRQSSWFFCAFLSVAILVDRNGGL